MKYQRFLICAIFVLAGCATAPRGPVDLEQGRAGLENLCHQGLSGACALASRPASPIHVLPVLQSVTSSQQSRFVVVVPKNEHLLYFLLDGTKAVRLSPERYEREFSTAATDQVEAFGLQPGRDYQLVIIGVDGRLWDQRGFQALDLNKARARVAVISCMDDHLKEIADKMWPQVSGQKPDVILMIGDNVYADHVGPRWTGTTPEIIWQRYVETRQDLPFFKIPNLIPVVATWDDHDFGHNDADRTFPYKRQSTETFFAFFAQRKPAPGFETGPGVASWWSAFGVHFALLDDRSFRSPNKLPLADQTHFGVDQEKWLQTHLAAADAPVWLVDGDQFFGGYHPFESYEGSHPRSFKIQLARWRKAKVPLLFVSGDRHLSEILKVPRAVLGYPTFEITSSGIHSQLFVDAFRDNPSPHQLVGVAGQYNYSIVEVMKANARLMQVGVQAFGVDGKSLYQKTLTVKH